MWYLLLYLLGVIVCWFIVAHVNDNTKERDKLKPAIILLSWALVLACILIILYDILWTPIKDFKIFNPSLKYFKNDRIKKG